MFIIYFLCTILAGNKICRSVFEDKDRQEELVRELTPTERVFVEESESARKTLLSLTQGFVKVGKALNSPFRKFAIILELGRRNLYLLDEELISPL
jgi:hypothetical protein